MPIAYRSILQVEPSNVLVEQVDQVVNDWFESKSLPRLELAGSVRVGERELSRTDAGESGFIARRWELAETWPAPRLPNVTQLDRGSALTTVTVVRTENRAWLWVDTSSPRIQRELADGTFEVESQQAGTPRLIADFVDRFAPTDGKAEPYTGGLLISTNSHVDELIEVLRDDTRLGAVFVSATPATSTDDAWVDRINAIIRGTEGMAVAYVLSTSALAYFNTSVMPPHAVRSGGLRTYLPGVLLGQRTDSHRHRIMAPLTVTTGNPRRLGHILRAAQVSRLQALKLPPVLQAADYALLREFRRRPLADIDAIRERSAAASTSHDLAKLRTINEELIAEVELHRAEALEALEVAHAEMDRQKDLVEQSELLALELEEAEDERENAADLVAALRRRLIRAQHVAEAWAPVDETEKMTYPDTFTDLVDMMNAFAHIRYAGDRDHPQKLDEHPNIRPAIHKAWDAIATLNDYARLSVANEFSGSFTHYLADPNHGGYNRLLNYKPTEGEGVQNNAKLAAQRMVVLPTGESMMMTAHVGLLNRRAGAPRLYFEDRVAAEQTVYIGYIGAHLLNAKLN